MSNICSIIWSTCEAIVEEYGSEVLKFPASAASWKEVANGFFKHWNFQHAKHIRIKWPAFGRSKYFSYKKFYSVILHHLVDADYKFLHVIVGATGFVSDASIFSQLS